MYPRSRSAFTLIELFIVVAIIGLLAAMLIPTIGKVRETSIVKKVESGERVDRETKQRYIEIKRKQREKNPTFKSNSSARNQPVEESISDAATVPFQRVTISGESFYLIPKQDAKETEIVGKVFWLIPHSN